MVMKVGGGGRKYESEEKGREVGRLGRGGMDLLWESRATRRVSLENLKPDGTLQVKVDGCGQGVEGPWLRVAWLG